MTREVALDGSLHWYLWTDRAFVDGSGAVVEFQSVGHDITDQRRAADFTGHQAEILEQVARGVPLDESLLTIASALEAHFPRFVCAIMLLDSETETLRVAAAPTLPSRFLETLEGTPVSATASSCGAAAHLREPVFVSDIASDSRSIEYRDVVSEHQLLASWSIPIIASDGTAVLGTLDVYVGERRVPDDEQRQIFLLLAQLASIAIERKAFEVRLAHQSMHDPLTGLPNRLLFLDRLGQAIARCQRTKSSVGVAFLDLDRFKNVNDSLGHDAGDELLVAVARKLEAVIRPGDTVARFGGDEFTVLCEDLTSDTAARSRGGDRRASARSGHPADGRARHRDVRRRERRDRARQLGRGAPGGAPPRRRRRDVPREGARPRTLSRCSTTRCAPARSPRTRPRTRCTARSNAASSGSSSSRSSGSPTRAASAPKRWCAGSIRSAA